MREIVIDLIRGQVVKSLMKPIPVVKFKPVTKSVTELGSGAKRVKVNVVVLERPPQPFYENETFAQAAKIVNGGWGTKKSKCLLFKTY